jgi:ornithine carbamoyltransferase
MATLYPMHFVLAAPEGYGPDEAILNYAQSVGLSTVEVVHDPIEAVRGADVIYTDVWASMGQEDEAEKRRAAFAKYQVDFRLLEPAQNDCVVMHCLPAHRGEEISAEVLEGSHSIVFDQAENRLHVQKALIARLVDNWRSMQARTGYVGQRELSLFGP